jgi:hypothetical protein
MHNIHCAAPLNTAPAAVVSSLVCSGQNRSQVPQSCLNNCICVLQGMLAGYMVANAKVSSSLQGLLTLAISVVAFIVKKTLLSVTDPICIETSMLIAGAPSSTPVCLVFLVFASLRLTAE